MSAVSSARAKWTPASRRSPSAPTELATTGNPQARASRIFNRDPPPIRNGTAMAPQRYKEWPHVGYVGMHLDTRSVATAPLQPCGRPAADYTQPGGRFRRKHGREYLVQEQSYGVQVRTPFQVPQEENVRRNPGGLLPQRRSLVVSDIHPIVHNGRLSDGKILPRPPLVLVAHRDGHGGFRKHPFFEAPIFLPLLLDVPSFQPARLVAVISFPGEGLDVMSHHGPADAGRSQQCSCVGGPFTLPDVDGMVGVIPPHCRPKPGAVVPLRGIRKR